MSQGAQQIIRQLLNEGAGSEDQPMNWGIVNREAGIVNQIPGRFLQKSASQLAAVRARIFPRFSD